MGEAGLRPQPCPTCCDRNGGRSPLATLARCEFATAFNAAWRLALSAADHQPHFCSRGQWARARLSSPEESSCIQLPKKELVGYRSIEAAGPGGPRDEIGPGRDRMGVPLFRIDFFSEDDGGSSYRPSFLDVIDEGGGGFFLPLPSMVRQRRCAFSGLSRSARHGSAVLAPAAVSKVWSCVPAVAGGSWPGVSASLRIGVFRRGDGRRCLPELGTIGLLCACFVISVKLRGFLVKWVCTVLCCAI